MEEQKAQMFSWNVIDLPVVIFNLIENLEVTAIARNNEKSMTQKSIMVLSS